MKKLAVTAIAFAIFLPRFSHGSPAGAEQHAIQLERDRQDAFVRGDIDFLDRTTADDYSTISAAGKSSIKSQMMANLRAHKTKVLSVKLSDMRGRVYGNTAVVTGVYDDVNIGSDGVQKEVHARFTRIFVKANGQWKAVAYQQTLAQ